MLLMPYVMVILQRKICLLNQHFSLILIKSSIRSSHLTEAAVIMILKANVFLSIHKNDIQEVCVGCSILAWMTF